MNDVMVLITILVVSSATILINNKWWYNSTKVQRILAMCFNDTLCQHSTFSLRMC